MKRPGAVEGNWYKVEKAVEFRTEPGTKKRQYKIRWQGYPASEDSWVDAEEIHQKVLEEFWTKGNKEATYKKRKGRRTRDGNTRPETLDMLRKEKEKILREITTQAQQVKAESQYLLSQIPPKQHCTFCSEFVHKFEHCYRAPWIIREENMAYLRCLGKGHRKSECQSQIMCWYCKSDSHNTFTCPEFKIAQVPWNQRQRPVYIHHYLDDSIIGHDECTSDLMFNTKDRICTIPSEWKEKRLVKGKFVYPSED